ncbi:MAG TPA: WYL domain-containing protein [Acidobacteriota bacterium]|nr:WYL domain-containing protein [Acidobacteriota bacterium]
MAHHVFQHTREHQRHLERIRRLDEWFRSGQFFTIRWLCEQLERSEKTVKRDLEELRNTHYRPLAYCARERAWHYTAPVSPLLPVSLSEGELVTILMAEQMARTYAGNTLGGQLSVAFSKILSVLTEAVSIELSQLAMIQSVDLLPTTDIDFALFETLMRAIHTRTRLEMTYFTQSSGKVSNRRVDPLHLHSSKGEWYLIAFDHNRNKVLDFHLGRVREYSLTSEHFEVPETFDLQAVLDSGFGMFRGSGDRLYDVVVEFDAYQAGWIAQQSKVHRTAEYTPLDGGGLRVTMRVGALEGVKMWLLQYGAHVKVIEPPELRQILKTEIEKMKELYED